MQSELFWSCTRIIHYKYINRDIQLIGTSKVKRCFAFFITVFLGYFINC